MYDDLARSLCDFIDSDFKSRATEWVGRFTNQHALYRALLKLKSPGPDLAYLEPELDGPPQELYARIKELRLRLKDSWPAGDYNTIANARKIPPWPMVALWSENDFETIRETRQEVLWIAIWDSFGAPYFVALWCALRSVNVPKGVFMFVYAGGGAGCCVGPRVGVTAGHCVSYSNEKPTPCLIMDAEGNVGLFVPTEVSREHDYSFGRLEGVDAIEPAPRAQAATGKPQVVCYGAPSSRFPSYKAKVVKIEWPWVKPIKRMIKAGYDLRAALADVRALTKINSYVQNYFHAVPGEADLAEIREGVFAHGATLAEGMSGGPIFVDGKLLGIHHSYCDEPDDDEEVPPQCVGRNGWSLGLLLSFAERTAYRDRATSL